MNVKINRVSLDNSPSFWVNKEVIKNGSTEMQIDCERTKIVMDRSVSCEILINLQRNKIDEEPELPLNVMPGFKLEWDEVDNYNKARETVVTDFSR